MMPLTSPEWWWTWAVGVSIAVMGWLAWRVRDRNGRSSDGKKQSRLPPGPPGLPIIGNILHLTDPKKPLHIMGMELAEVYGPLVLISVGVKKLVFVSSSEFVKEIFKPQDHLFANRPIDTGAKKYLIYGNYHVTVCPHGEYHSFHRKLLVSELLGPARIPRFQAVRKDELNLVIQEAFQASSSKLPGDGSVNVRSLVETLTINVITRMTFNKKFFGNGVTDTSTESPEEWKVVIPEVLALVAVIMAEDAFPALKWVDLLTGLRQRMQLCFRKADILWQELVDKRRRELDALRPEELEGFEAKSFLDVLLLLQKAGKYPQYIDDMSMKGVVQDLVIAGSDTNSTVIEWALTELLLNPDVMTKVQAELDSVVGKDRCVEESDVPKFPYLAAVVKETFRIHPPVPLLLPRTNFTDCQVGGYHIPANSSTFINVYALGRDPTFWEEPLKFKPERFLSGGKHVNVDVKGSHPQLSPFGGGRRICPGMSLSQVIIPTTLARFIHSFNWSLPPRQSGDFDMSEVSSTVVKRKDALQAVPIPRLPLHLYQM